MTTTSVWGNDEGIDNIRLGQLRTDDNHRLGATAMTTKSCGATSMNDNTRLGQRRC
jgi:hypothetical protein